MSTTDTTNGSPRTLRVLLGVLAAVIVLGLLWFFVVSPLLLTDGDELEESDVQSPATQPTETPTEDPVDDDAADTVAALPIETYEVFLSRDPFDPVIPQPATGGDGTGDGATGDGTTGDGTPGDGNTGDGDGTTGVRNNAVLIDVFTDESGTRWAMIRVDDVLYTVTAGVTFGGGYEVESITTECVTLVFQGERFTLCEGGGSNGGDGDAGGDGGGETGQDGCTNGDEVVCDGRVVTLVDVFTDDAGTPTAVVQVDNTLYEVRTGDTFAQNFQVAAIDAPCVTLLYGDDAFTLCEGQRTLK